MHEYNKRSGLMSVLRGGEEAKEAYLFPPLPPPVHPSNITFQSSVVTQGCLGGKGTLVYEINPTMPED